MHRLDIDQVARGRRGSCLLLFALLIGCAPAPPAEHHRIELPGGTLVVDIEMAGTWEKDSRSKFSFEPREGGPPEAIGERWGRLVPRVVSGDVEPEVRLERPSYETLAILAGERILLRLPQTVGWPETLIVRAGPDDWQSYRFDDRSIAGLPVWDGSLRPLDAQTGGFCELSHIDIPRLEFTFYYFGGYLLRELAFRLAPDGRSIELTKIRRAPLEAACVGHSDPAWASAALLDRARDLFLDMRLAQEPREPDWVLDDIRIVEFYDCPDTGPPDRLRVLFGLRQTPGVAAGALVGPEVIPYRTEMWRFDSVGGEWQAVTAPLLDPTPSVILDRGRATYKEVQNCIKVY